MKGCITVVARKGKIVCLKSTNRHPDNGMGIWTRYVWFGRLKYKLKKICFWMLSEISLGLLDKV